MSQHEAPSFDIPYVPEALEQVVKAELINGVADRLDALIEEQPWYKKYSNTVNGGLGALGAAIGFILVSGMNLPGWVIIVLGLLAALIQTLIIKSTKNGLTQSTRVAVTNPTDMSILATDVTSVIQGTVDSAYRAVPQEVRDGVETIKMAVLNKQEIRSYQE